MKILNFELIINDSRLFNSDIRIGTYLDKMADSPFFLGNPKHQNLKLQQDFSKCNRFVPQIFSSLHLICIF